MNSFPIVQSVDQNLSCKAVGISEMLDSQQNDRKVAQSKNLKFAFKQAGPKKVFHCEKQSDFQSQDTCASEEVLEESHEKSNLELEDIYEEVFRLKRRIGRLNYQLGTNILECPNIDLCQGDQIFLTNSAKIHPDILQIKIASHKLEQQLTQMQSVTKSSSLAKQMARNDYCRIQKLGDQLHIGIQKLESFKLKFEKHQGLCLQRFRFLNENKFSGREFKEYIEKSNEMIRTHLNKQILKNEYIPFRKEAAKVTISLKKSAENLQDHLSNVINNKKHEMFQNLKNSSVSIRSDL
ncbi:LOW QUALITY PROTEIN: uncharacterized protein LOC122621247 [Drosophila teissieri]|uniref:LOW QUALITY PROTEIN: uncharacterized protein LOC122621247 n=1 Tax=Drosophila teissieri TaxID=7243 RepID=UPI001CB9F718|nr:LOW QUALITY PROTEIN: uncharacterized protein LOC122621247 [Drosophila teissieri]